MILLKRTTVTGIMVVLAIGVVTSACAQASNGGSAAGTVAPSTSGGPSAGASTGETVSVPGPSGSAATSGTSSMSAQASGSSAARSEAPKAPSSGQAAASPATTSPGTPLTTAGGPINLTSWAAVLLPINSSGQLSGKNAWAFKPVRPVSPWLTQGSDGSLGFWAPAGAATTPGSTHSRTELESGIHYTVGTQRHVLTAALRITQLPRSNPEICVAQLHAGGANGSNPFVMIDFKSGKLYVMVATGTSASPSFYTLLTGVPTGAALTYRLADNGNGTLTIAASSGSQNQSYTVPIPAAEQGVSGHFSAGDYQQGVVSSGPDDGGRVTFTTLAQS
jgi:hypothetical protein